VREPPQQQDDRHRERGVDRQQHPGHDADTARGGDAGRRAHDAVDDPRLAPDLGRRPAGEQGDQRQRSGGDDEPVEQARARQPSAAPPDDEVGDPQQRQQRPDRDHRLEGEAHDVDRRAAGGTAPSPWMGALAAP
jgi:hypothetical protein